MSLKESDHNTPPSLDPGLHNNVTDSDSDTDKSVADTNRPTLALKMLTVCKELAIMILLAVAYAALTNERPPKVTKSPAAYPFFPRDSLISDWYRGQITEAIEDARASDIAFVMFYAPWDADSQVARHEFEVTAKYMYERVSFAAVNCWQPGSECKRQYSKVYKWPVLIAYPTHGRGIQYNGPLEAFHMIRFLQNVCKPLVRVETLDDLMGKHNVVISAHINTLPGSYEYAIFYSAALRYLERDPFRDTVFAVVSQRGDYEASIYLHNWNGTIEFDTEWTVEALINWITANSQHITGWVAPTGMKSLTLSNLMQPGPSLILFTPKNPIFTQNDYYNMLREVAYDYHNCANNTHVSKRLRLVRQERKKNRANYKQLKEKCTSAPRSVVINNVWTNTSVKNMCSCVNTCNTSDRLSPDQLQKTVHEEACLEFLLGAKYAAAIFGGRGEGGVNITGLSCSGNTSLNFLAIDSLRFYKIAERLGVDLSKMEDRSGVVVVNEKMESHYVMATNVSLGSLKSFIYNFTNKGLVRSLQSTVHVEDRSDHVYPYLGCSKTNQVCVEELTSKNFLSTILEKNRDVVVFYYSKQCSFCNGVGYIFLTLAKMLAAVDAIKFTRIDGESNLLPWEYTMDSYPTILLLPTRKSESRTFPKSIPITVQNVIGFILTNVELDLKLQIMWSLCRQSKYEKSQCLVSLRMETLTFIGKLLKEWRLSNRKQKVLYKLQVLRQLHLLFAHSPDDIVQIKKYLSKLRG